MKSKEMDIYSEERRRIHEPSNPVRYTPKKCIAKTKQDCFYFNCIFNHHNGGDCTKEEQLPAEGIDLRHRVKVENTCFENIKLIKVGKLEKVGQIFQNLPDTKK